MKTKKSQVGLTISWFGAVIVIFFIMFIFVAFTFGLFAQRSISILLSNIFNSESSSKALGMGDLESQQKLFYLLETRVDSNDFRELVLKYNKDSGFEDSINGNASRILENTLDTGRCFIFQIDNNYVRNKNFEVKNRIFPQISIKIPENKPGKNIGLYFGEC